MSRSLFFDIEPLATNTELEPVERRTWARLALWVNGRCVTEFRRTGEGQVEKTLHLPLIPIAEWMVQNWWALLHEPCRGEAPPKENVSWSADEKAWLSRHCMRVADSALFLPYAHFFSNGKGVMAAWFEDHREVLGDRFLGDGAEMLDRSEAEGAFHAFVTAVLDMLNGVHEVRVEQLRRDWSAICNADIDERRFCEAAGCMGLDPYDVAAWPEDIEPLLLGALGKRMGEPIAGDFLESTEPAQAAGLWNWIQDTETRWRLKGHAPYWTEWTGGGQAKDVGYGLAGRVRSELGLTDGVPIGDFSEITDRLEGLRLTFEEHNHVPSQNVRAVVGWTDMRTAAIVGPGQRPENQRFLMARGLCQALVGCGSGARLLSNAKTWDQQVGRAFAAELLAPKAALAEVARSDMDYEEQDECQTVLAAKYGVSPVVIALQLHNHGVW